MSHRIFIKVSISWRNPALHIYIFGNATEKHTQSVWQETSCRRLDDRRDISADPWHWWNQIRGLCGHHSKLGVLLEVPENLPSKELMHRWLGEPVKALILPISVFQTNKRGFPTLSKAHQDLLLLFFRHNVQVISSLGLLDKPLLLLCSKSARGLGSLKISRELIWSANAYGKSRSPVDYIGLCSANSLCLLPCGSQHAFF